MEYFAYGTNMSPEVMRARCPGHRFLGAAVLPAHRLAFTRRSVITGTGVADIVVDPDREVWGALYQLGERDLGRLDAKEGVGFAYIRTMLAVTTADETVHRAVAYTVASREAAEVRPSADYLDRLVEGARERMLPACYVDSLRRLLEDWGPG